MKDSKSIWLSFVPVGRGCQQERRDPAKLWAQGKWDDLIWVALNLIRVFQLSGIVSIKAAVLAG